MDILLLFVCAAVFCIVVVPIWISCSVTSRVRRELNELRIQVAHFEQPVTKRNKGFSTKPRTAAKKEDLKEHSRAASPEPVLPAAVALAEHMPAPTTAPEPIEPPAAEARLAQPSTTVPDSPTDAAPDAAPEPVIEPAAAALTAPPEEPPHTARQTSDAGASSAPANALSDRQNDWAQKIKGWLFTGNLVAKLGLIILFVGVAFLIKYAAERIHIPIEVRLAAITVADLGLLMWAWKIRAKRRDIALPAQGIAIAILMLVAFSSYHTFQLIPAGFAFTVLALLTAFTCLLAVSQEAVWLAAFGIAGGFAAPILISTGQGNHIALFSYYAVLNSAVFYISYQRAWRLLNLLGFTFTVVVGVAWGWSRYQPEQYLSAQLFIALFFLLYVAIPVAFAYRRAPLLKECVDAILLIGAPLIGFGLQYGLVQDTEYGTALSSFALGAFYLALAQILWRHRRPSWRPLVETFLGLGLVFATLALPLAFDSRWTSAAWAVEGAGIVWIGLRQRDPRIWVFGLLLQVGSWVAFIASMRPTHYAITAESHIWVGFMLLAGAAFAIAGAFRRTTMLHEDQDLAGISNSFLVMAGAWLLSGLWYEAYLRTSYTTYENMLVAASLLTAIIFNIIASSMQWRLARRLAMIAQFAGAAALFIMVHARADWAWLLAGGQADADQPVLGFLMIAAAALFTSWSMRQQLTEQQDKSMSLTVLVWGGFWWFLPLLHSVAGHAMYLLGLAGSAHWTLLYDLLVAGSALAFTVLSQRLGWRDLRLLGISLWLLLALRSLQLLYELYADGMLAPQPVWIAFAVLWLGSEFLLITWAKANWTISSFGIKLLHLLRSGTPWLAIWPAMAIIISRWLGSVASDTEYTDAGSWSTYIPAWIMMLVVAAIMRQARVEAWPTRPISLWYRTILIPCAVAWSVLLVTIWNLQQDGTMAPLPYLPVLNPLDLTTGLVVVLALSTARMLQADLAASAPTRQRLPALPEIGALAFYAWFNLMLLRSASHFLDIPYRIDSLMASIVVQTMFSLVWTGTALLLMVHSGQRKRRYQWGAGALLLAVVVVKLVLVDLANSGTLARIVSFLGVGILMVAIGYLAPYPSARLPEQDKLPA